jgi:subtilisin family serine protease
MALKFLSANGGGSEANAVKCIYYALANGARVLNNSWGTPYESEELEEAIRAAQDLGVLFIAAAGNDSSDNDLSSNFPSNYSHAKYKLDNVISVAAVDSDGKLASFSNYGKSTVDLAAPGAGILSTIRSSDWRSLSGTSMATPHVAGAAALIWSRDESKDWREIKKLLLDNVMKSPALEGKVASGGRLDIGFLASAPPDNGNDDDDAVKKIVNAGGFFHKNEVVYRSDTNLIEAKITLKKKSLVYIRASSTATTACKSQIFSTGFCLKQDLDKSMFKESVRLITISQKDQFVNFGSLYAIKLEAGTHLIYWRIRIPSGGGDVRIRGGGFMTLRAVPID